jgi:hypothetical protein
MRRKLQEDRKYRLIRDYQPQLNRTPDHGPLWDQLSARLNAAGDKGISGATINATCRNLRNPRFGDYLLGQLGCLEEVSIDLR